MHRLAAAAKGGAAVDERLEANRANWNDRVPIHLQSRFYDVEGWLRARPGPSPDALEAVGPVRGLRLLHLQCHLGLETLAWARAGAQVTGLDFAAAAVDAARDLAVRAQLADRARFVCADVQEAAAALGGAQFDVVFVSEGSLCWLPSVGRWAAQVGALLAPGGLLYVHDGHPLAQMLAEDRLVVREDYFETDASSFSDSPHTYTDAAVAVAHGLTHEWNHGLGEIVTALLRQGLRLESLREHPWAGWRRFPWLVAVGDDPESVRRFRFPEGVPAVPLTFTLIASRPADVGPGEPPPDGSRCHTWRPRTGRVNGGGGGCGSAPTTSLG